MIPKRLLISVATLALTTFGLQSFALSIEKNKGARLKTADVRQLLFSKRSEHGRHQHLPLPGPFQPLTSSKHYLGGAKQHNAIPTHLLDHNLKNTPPSARTHGSWSPHTKLATITTLVLLSAAISAGLPARAHSEPAKSAKSAAPPKSSAPHPTSVAEHNTPVREHNKRVREHNKLVREYNNLTESAQIASENGDFQKAYELYAKALEHPLFGKSPVTLANMGHTCLQLGKKGPAAERKAHLNEAIQYLTKSMGKNPIYDRSLYFKKDDNKKRLFENAVLASSNLATAYMELAFTHVDKASWVFNPNDTKKVADLLVNAHDAYDTANKISEEYDDLTNDKHVKMVANNLSVLQHNAAIFLKHNPKLKHFSEFRKTFAPAPSADR